MKKFLTQHKTSIAIALVVFVILPATYYAARYYFSEIHTQQNEMQEIENSEELIIWEMDNLPQLIEYEELILKQQQILKDVFVRDTAEAKVALADLFYEKIAPDTNMFVEVIPVKNVAKKKALKPKRATDTSENEEKVLISEEEEKKIDPFEPENNRYFQLEITADGTYDDFIRFLHKIENMQHLSDITAIDVKRVKIQSQRDTRLRQSSENEDTQSEQDIVPEDQVSAKITVVFYLEEDQNKEEDSD